MKLKEYAAIHGIQYRSAWNRFKQGKIKGAYYSDCGDIIIPDNVQQKEQYVVCYARVSSSENKSNLDSQAKRITDFANAKGFIVKEVIKECASGMNDNRPKLNKLLLNPFVTDIIVEHKDRLTRFGFNYLLLFAKSKNINIIVINESETDKQDLMQDFVSLVTSFTARLYGLRRSKRKTEQLIKELQNDKKK